MAKVYKSQMFGLLHNRRKEVGTYTQDKEKGNLIVWVTNCDKPASEWEIEEKSIHFPTRQVAVRFAACRGNQVALMDMNKNPKIWLTDLDGKIRFKIPGREYGLVQPSGGCFDSVGNLIMSDSKAKKIVVFDPEGKYLNQLEVVTHETLTYVEELPTRMTGTKMN